MKAKSFFGKEPDFSVVFFLTVLTSLTASAFQNPAALSFYWQKIPGFYSFYGAGCTLFLFSAGPFLMKAFERTGSDK